MHGYDLHAICNCHYVISLLARREREIFTVLVLNYRQQILDWTAVANKVNKIYIHNFLEKLDIILAIKY